MITLNKKQSNVSAGYEKNTIKQTVPAVFDPRSCINKVKQDKKKLKLFYYRPGIKWIDLKPRAHS